MSEIVLLFKCDAAPTTGNGVGRTLHAPHNPQHRKRPELIEDTTILLALREKKAEESVLRCLGGLRSDLFICTSPSQVVEVVGKGNVDVALIGTSFLHGGKSSLLKKLASLSPDLVVILYADAGASAVPSLDGVENVFSIIDSSSLETGLVPLQVKRAVEARRLHRSLLRRLEHMKSYLARLGRTAPTDGERRNVMRDIVERAMVIADCEVGQLILIDKGGRVWREFWNGYDWADEEVSAADTAREFANLLQHYNRAASRPDGTDAPVPRHGVSLARLRPKRYYSVPVLNERSKVIGFIEVGSKASANGFTEHFDTRSLLKELSSRAASLVDGTGSDPAPGASPAQRQAPKEGPGEPYRRYLDGLPDPAFLVQGDRLRFVNRKAFDTLLYEPREFYSLNLYDIVDEAHRKPLREALNAVLSGARMEGRDLVMLDRQKRPVQLEAWAWRVEADGGAAALMIGRTKQPPLMSGVIGVPELAAAMRCLHSAVTITDMDLNIKYINPAHVKIFGYTLGELIGKKSSILYPFDDSSSLSKKIYEAVLIVGWEGERLWVRKSGEVFPVYEKTSVVKDRNGTAVGIVSVIEDITLRKRLEQALRESEERYRTLVETAKTPIVAVDDKGVVMMFNPAAQELFGYDYDEIVGKEITPLLPEPHAERLSAGLEHVLQTVVKEHVGRTVEFEGRRRDGETFPLEASISSCRIGGKQIYTAIVLDITERKQLQEKLIQSEKMAAIGQLISGVTHEVNNPLAVVLGYSEMLLMDEGLGGEARSFVKVIHEEAMRAKEVIHDLLSFARKHEANKRPVNLNDVVEKTLHLKEYDFKKNNIRVDFTPDTALPTVQADPNQIQQVLLNLFINAEHSMVTMNGQDGSLLTIRTGLVDGAEAPDGKRYVCVLVADNGHGVDEKHMNKIFDPFFTTKPEGEGTGLGLSVSYGIIKEHEGHIRVYNNESGGATFEILLPVSEEQGEAAARAH